MWLDVRAGVIVNQDHSSGVTHTVAIHNDESGGFRLYDSDSEARSQGTYERVRADELMDRYSTGCLIGIMGSGSDLSNRIGGEGLKTLAQREKRPHENEQTHNTKARAEGTGAGKKRNAKEPSSRTEGKKKTKVRIVLKQSTLGKFTTPSTAESDASSGTRRQRKRKAKLTKEDVEQAIRRLTGLHRGQCRVSEILGIPK